MALIALYVLLPLGLLGIAASWFKKPDTLPIKFPPSSVLLLVIPVILFVILRSYVGSRVVGLLGGDEYCRVHYGWMWAQNPFFAVPDHIWPAGHFYALGIGYQILHDMPMVVELSSTAGMLATIGLSMLLAWQVWRSQVAALAVGLLVAGQHVILWTSFNPLAEAFTYPLMLSAACLWVWGYNYLVAPDREENRPSFPPTNRANLLFGLSAIPLALGTMFRFEMWFAGIALGAFFCFRSLWIIIKRAEEKPDPNLMRAVPLLVGAVVLAIYPLLWMASSWKHLGSPVAFLLDAQAANTATDSGFYPRGNMLNMATAYPRALWGDHWTYLVLAVAGILVALKSEHRRRIIPYLLAVGAVLFVSMLTTGKTGLGSNYRPRYTTWLMLLFLPLAGGPVSAAWNAWDGKISRLVLRPLVILALIVFGYYSASYGRTRYSNAYGIDSEVLSTAVRLGVALEVPRPESDTLLFWGTENRVAVYLTGAVSEYADHWTLRYHAAHPERVIAVTTAEEMQSYVSTGILGDILIVNRSGKVDLPEEKLKLVQHFSQYAMYRVVPMPQP